jgi:hypothetical protein
MTEILAENNIGSNDLLNSELTATATGNEEKKTDDIQNNGDTKQNNDHAIVQEPPTNSNSDDKTTETAEAAAAAVNEEAEAAILNEKSRNLLNNVEYITILAYLDKFHEQLELKDYSFKIFETHLLNEKNRKQSFFFLKFIHSYSFIYIRLIKK